MYIFLIPNELKHLFIFIGHLCLLFYKPSKICVYYSILFYKPTIG